MKTSVGFPYDVDQMMRNAANVETCPEREKYVVLLIDEMYVEKTHWLHKLG